MGFSDRNVDKRAKLAVKVLPVNFVTAVNQSDVKALSFAPGHAFEIVGVSLYCLGATPAGATVNVKIGTTSVLTGAITPVAGSEVAGTLATTYAARRGTATDAINVHYTTDADAVLTNACVIVQYRPRPLNGEA